MSATPRPVVGLLRAEATCAVCRGSGVSYEQHEYGLTDPLTCECVFWAPAKAFDSLLEAANKALRYFAWHKECKAGAECEVDQLRTALRDAIAAAEATE